jgi:hypothetical protein
MRSLLSACSRSRLAFSVIAALVPIVPLAAQCGPQWQLGHGIPGTNGPVNAATLWFPNAGDQQHPHLVVGGGFNRAGSGPASAVAAFDLVTRTWRALGDNLPPDSSVRALAVLPNGDLVAGTTFNWTLSPPPRCLYVWDGTTWSPLGGGLNGAVTALEVLPNGDLIVCGAFTQAGSVSCWNVARWDGANWHALGQGTSGAVRAITVLPNGHLAVAESYSTTLLPWNPGWVIGIHVWDGASWTTIAQPNLPVWALATMPNGDLVAGGSFTDIGNRIARWSGGAWIDLGSPGPAPWVVDQVAELAVLTNGDLVAAGSFTMLGGTNATNIARWDGTGWSSMGGGVENGGNAIFEMPTGEVIVGGYFTTAGSIVASCVAAWDGVDWHALGDGLDGAARTIAELPNGDLIAGGAFAHGLGATLHGVGRYDGSAWHPLGAGMAGGDVHAIETLGGGDVIAAGAFTTAGSTLVGAIARWDGTTWWALGSGLAGGMVPAGNALVETPNGDVIVGGEFTTAGGVAASAIARWNGTSWSALGTGLQGGTLGVASAQALLALPGGNVVVAGRFQSAGGVVANGVARWNGTAWSAMGTGLAATSGTVVRSLALLSDGDVIAGGTFAGIASGVARWNGTQWLPVGALTGTVQSVVALPNGDVVAGGHLAGGTTTFMRWTNGAWVPFVTGQDAFDVYAMKLMANGELVVAADFTVPNLEYLCRILRVATTCPAIALPDGAGCTGAGGPNALTAATLPWIGSTLRADATGLAANSLAVGVFGLVAAAMPLSSVLPQGLPGCTLLVMPDFMLAGVPSGGHWQTQLVIPNTMALATQSFRQQVVALELGAGAAITAVTGTNALAVTIGAF